MARRNRTELPDSDEAPVATPDFLANETPMERFRALARRLVGVPRRELEQERQRYLDNKAKKPHSD
jgi:hypothetical protein